MSTFGIKCPGCGILLEADENDIGAKVECTECGRPFILARNPDPSSAETANDTVTFTFDAFPKNLDYSQPLSLTMPNGTFPVKYWSEVLVRCYDYAYQNNRDKVESLADIEAPPPLRKDILFARDPQVLRTARELSPGFYMEVNFSAHSIVKNVCGLMAYCGFPVKEFSVTYRVKSSEPPAPESKVDAPVSSSEFSKPLDFSTFTTGITIPVRVHEAFLKHLSVKLERGKSHPVTIMVGDSSFQVSINNIDFSDPNRKQVLMFLWRKNSPLAKSFQATFPAVFEQLSEDHSNRDGIDTVLTVSCGEQPDVFKIAMDTPLLENKKPDTPVQAETVAPASPEASVSEVAPFITVLLRDFSAGFEFNDSSVRLLESAAGRPCPKSVQKELKRRMFRRYDGIYLLPEMVADGETLGAIKHRIEEYFDQFHAFSLPVLYGEFEGALHALTNPDSDFRLFLLGAILPEFPEGGKVFGKLQKQIGIPGSLEEQDVLDFLARIFIRCAENVVHSQLNRNEVRRLSPVVFVEVGLEVKLSLSVLDDQETARDIPGFRIFFCGRLCFGDEGFPCPAAPPFMGDTVFLRLPVGAAGPDHFQAGISAGTARQFKQADRINVCRCQTVADHENGDGFSLSRIGGRNNELCSAFGKRPVPVHDFDAPVIFSHILFGGNKTPAFLIVPPFFAGDVEYIDIGIRSQHDVVEINIGFKAGNSVYFFRELQLQGIRAQSQSETRQ